MSDNVNPPSMDPMDEMNDLRMSKEALPLLDHVKRFIKETVDPMYEEYERLGEGHTDRWTFAPGQLEALQKAKDKAKEEGLWNFFLPDAETGEGLSNLDYAYIAVELGKSPLASEAMNCSAPDTGNMEVLERVGTQEQKDQWLRPLLDGEIRSAYVMTEPDVASSDAKNVHTRAVLEDGEWVINGEKFFASGAGDPRCKIMIVMVQTSPDAPPASSTRRFWCRRTRLAWRSSAPWRSSARTTRHAVTCTSASTTCACRSPTCCSVRAAASRSPSCVSDPAASTTACAPSARPRSRLT
ncbi:acyl-CoA dehydrogenase family protein [Blastococcus sp. Marseille-P5729]|uniref:acyl-CoA dehydrogenase family protein n=1 Tax=Blastococcus sp. Marseille-P5729 TaxID=2086582 RepID=UPI001F43FB17|nr:acyl-CoA dehydrogenase family protein [Blastococcus sp. Marseille-P5729]